MIVLVSGGSGSGKSTFASKFDAVLLSTDDFYRPRAQVPPRADGSPDFDRPDAVDLAACRDAALALEAGRPADIPVYDMKLCEPVGARRLEPAETGIVVVEGIFALCSPLCEVGELRIFIDTPLHLRVARRIERDVKRGRTPMESLHWSILVEQAYEQHVEPTRRHAHVVLGREGW
jgi:uridine kinase